ncbi:MAG: porphobilinogen synthase [bacterium]|nr:porphobilinogen synthase [bacterium]
MKRLQRLRRTDHLRNMLSETSFSVDQLIQPLFTVEGISKNEIIPGLLNNERMTIESTLKQVESDLKAGVRQFLLFVVPKEKCLSNFNHHFAETAVRAIKERFPNDLTLWVDTCLCSLTTTGHCCVSDENGTPKLDETLKALSELSLCFVNAGADGVSPSDMNDGRVSAMRSVLDEAGHSLVPIMSYSTKFASSFYGPFRLAADSAPQYGNRKHYQLDVRNRSDAIGSSIRCAEEGADLLMVKPGMTSIDLIAPITEKTSLPVGAYQVSGEYAGMALLAKEGLLNFHAGLLESWHVFRRAGARFIITYGARNANEIGLK